jgi:hypothetical protein
MLPDDGPRAAETRSSNEQQMYIVSDILNIKITFALQTE